MASPQNSSTNITKGNAQAYTGYVDTLLRENKDMMVSADVDLLKRFAFLGLRVVDLSVGTSADLEGKRSVASDYQSITDQLLAIVNDTRPSEMLRQILVGDVMQKISEAQAEYAGLPPEDEGQEGLDPERSTR